MATKSLSNLSFQDKDVAIQVQVNRKWEFRGNGDNRPILHIDMILTDNTGNAIYAEIPADLVTRKKPLDVGKVYIIRRFKVSSAKTSFTVIDGPIMIHLTPYTMVEVCRDPPETFLQYVYRLIPYNEIDPYGSRSRDFHDVIGVIIDDSGVEPVQLKTRQSLSMKRTILIKDTSDNTMQVTLWGNRASQFSYDSIYDAENETPIVVLFVGCLPKQYKDV